MTKTIKLLWVGGVLLLCHPAVGQVWVDGQWGPVISWPHVAVSAANLPDGRVLTWSGSERDTWPTTEQTYSGTWNPATGEFIEIFHDGHNMFCSHLAMAEDGRVFVNGGRNQTNSPWTSLFDYTDDSWEQIENMPSGGRWYPTTLALSDGDMFTAIGTATNQRNPERWDPVGGWQVQLGIDFNDMVLDDYQSSYSESRWWPLLHVAPNGKIFHSGPTPQMHWINPTGSGEYEPVGTAFTDWYTKHGTTVMYDEGKLLTAGGWIGGGNILSSNQAYTIDLNGASPVITPTASMQHARKFHNGVILPTGEVLVVGGNTSGRKFSDDGAIMEPEVWDPDTETWRELAPMTIPRNYHSIALLLVDGRVLAAGSGYNSNSVPASTHQDGQVFSPPYLFATDGSPAARPAISGAPGMVETGSTFSLTTNEAVAYFSLVKMSSTTHGLNTDLRFLKPQFTATGGNSYDVTLHANPNVASPGYWMLFAVNAAGVPSEAHVLRITTVDTRLENRALSGTVSQSSTPVGGPDLQAANAIDGDLSGDAASGSLAATEVDTNAWWEIDLGQTIDIDTIRIWNRTDCCTNQLSDYYLLLSAQPFVSQDLQATRQQAGVTEVYHAGPAPRQTDVSVGTVAQYVRVQLAGVDTLPLAEVQMFGSPAAPPPPPPPPETFQVENGRLEDVGSAWQTVTLTKTFVDPVVVATPEYDGTQLPAVTRIRNAGANQFEIRVQNPSNTPLNGYPVNFFVVEAGVYTVAQHGIALEAVKFESTVTDENGSWVGESRAYNQTYVSPVVIGQVMTENDPRWSVFWASNGSYLDPPASWALSVGKHVAEDTDIVRASETIGYVVIESGSGSIDGINYTAAVGADIVQGVVQAAPYQYALGGTYDLAVLSSAAMEGVNGGWPVLTGTPSVSTTVGMGIDEDQIADVERNRVTDQVAYLAMTQSAVGPRVTSVSTAPEVVGATATFTANAEGQGPLLYSWNFGAGDSPFSTDNTATFTFSTAGRNTATVTVRDASGNEVQQSFVQLTYLPPTASPPSTTTGIIDYPSRGEVWNVNPDNNSVTVIAPDLESVLAEIPVPADPRSIAIAPDGRVWVTSKKASSISIIDPTTYGIAQYVFFEVGARPHGLVIGASTAYVALEGRGEVAKVNAFTGAELQRAYVGEHARHVALDSGESNLFVSLFVTPPLPGEATAAPVVDDGVALYGGQVRVLDPGTLIENTTVVLQHSDRLVSEHSGPGVPNYLGPAAISPDGTSAWVPSKQDNILAGALRGGQGMTFDQTVRAVSSKIDMPGMTESFPMRVDHDNASVASYAAIGPYGLHLFAALEGNREIAVVDVHSGVEILRFDVGRAPQSIAVSDDGTRLYVHNFMDRTVGIYDTDQLINFGAISVTQLATVSTVSAESLSPDVFTGKQLFYDARDDRLAAQDYMSCASCHNDGAEDGRVWDFTGVGEGLRNTITLWARAGMGHGNLHWTANFDEVQDFEAQIRTFSGGTGLMSDTDFNFGTRSQPLGDPKAGLSADLDSLAAYVASLNEVPASPFRPLDRSFTAEAQLGAVVFETAGCASCHALTRLTDSDAVPTMHDVGTLSPSSGNRLGGPLLGLDTPTLLGAWATAPYLHDGSEPTLQSAIAAHQGVSLTSSELDQLAALISELESGTELLTNTGMKLGSGVVSVIGSDWVTVTLADNYVDMVVIASIQYDSNAAPAVTRVRNASDNSFDVRVQSPSGEALSGYTVHYVVVEAGIYNVAEHGIAMEAVKFDSTVTDENNSWVGESRAYSQSYVSPVVIGQVMTHNDPRWSVFWAASSGAPLDPPSSSALSVGKHVGEDPDTNRTVESIGYIVIEAGSGSLAGFDYTAGRTPRIVSGILQGAPYVTAVGGQYTSGVVSSAGMRGVNGGWPLLYGSDPLASEQLDLAIDEDVVGDIERGHITEEVAYFLLR